jgi:Asp-tRNA(Asn)/Glu-tRNA(Gln) amidotransferase B subunit
LHKEGDPLGTRTEVKNIGSVRGVAQAIAYEIHRQTEILDGGGRIFNETRQWDAENKVTIAMRDKEVVQDYRFMPEPNLPPLRVSLSATVDENSELVHVQTLREQLPELPQRTRDYLTLDYGLSKETAIVLVVMLHSERHLYYKKENFLFFFSERRFVAEAFFENLYGQHKKVEKINHKFTDERFSELLSQE